MSEVAVRPRYNKNSAINRRKKRNIRQADKTDTLMVIVTRQVIIAVILLLFLTFIKNVHTPATNMIMGKVKAVISQDIDIKAFFSSFDNTLKKISGNKNAKDDNTSKVDNTSKDNNSPLEIDATSKGTGSEKNGTASGAETEVNPGNESENAVVAGTTNISKGGIFIEPVSGYLSSGFGERINPIKKTAENHKGIDIEANKGVTIKAAMDGEITETGNEPTYGLYVKMKHDGGYSTVYAHCSSISVKKGQKVKQGDTIAKVGDTGLATGAHLHFEIWKNEKAVNPIEYISVPSKS